MSYYNDLNSDFSRLDVDDRRRDEGYYNRRDPPSPHYGTGPSPNPPYGTNPSYPSQHHQQSRSIEGDSGPPAYSPPQDKPPIPAGWVPLWDRGHQRWYYAEEASGRSQWEAPGYVPPRPAYDSREAGYGYAPSGVYGEQSRDEGKSHSGLLLGAAGGLAAGAIGGALLEHALDNSDDEHGHGAPVYADEVSNSDRESLEEAREDYQEALDDARDSDASSSDQEELEEAREEYQEEYEEAYYDE